MIIENFKLLIIFYWGFNWGFADYCFSWGDLHFMIQKVEVMQISNAK